MGEQNIATCLETFTLLQGCIGMSPLRTGHTISVSVSTSKRRFVCVLGVCGSICLFVDPQRSIWQQHKALNPSPINADTSPLLLSKVKHRAGMHEHTQTHTHKSGPSPPLPPTWLLTILSFSDQVLFTQSRQQLEDCLSERGRQDDSRTELHINY